MLQSEMFPLYAVWNREIHWESRVSEAKKMRKHVNVQSEELAVYGAVRRLRLRYRNTRNMRRQIRTIPPIAPAAIAPVGVCFEAKTSGLLVEFGEPAFEVENPPAIPESTEVEDTELDNEAEKLPNEVTEVIDLENESETVPNEVRAEDVEASRFGIVASVENDGEYVM